MAELKPCPFCGESKTVLVSRTAFGLYYVGCSNDLCKVRPQTNKTVREIDCMNTWNRRTETVSHAHWVQDDVMPQYAYCYCCWNMTRANGIDITGNAHVHKAVYKYCPKCGAKMDEVQEDGE